jgi:hypothetical protein
LYVSDKKVNELVDRLPQSIWGRLKPTVGINVPPVNIALALKEQSTRRQVLATIEKALKKNGELGSIAEQPRAYVKGTLPMRWEIREDIRPQIVWFVGSTADTVVAFGGRARHLTGLYHDELKDKSKPESQLRNYEIDVAADLAGQLEDEGLAPPRESRDWATNVSYLWDFGGGETEKVDFLAAVEKFSGDALSGTGLTGALLGSPVWVFKSH